MGAKLSLEGIRLRKTLEQYRSELVSRVARTKVESRVSEKFPADFGDVYTQTPGREDIFNQLNSSQHLLALVEAALLRIQQGAFGRCLEFHEVISIARLRAIPWADCYKLCQEQRERYRAL